MSTIAALRQAIPHLADYTDDEIANVIATVQGGQPGTKPFKKAADAAKGYDRSITDVVKDAGVGLGSGLLGIAKTAGAVYGAIVPSEKAFDNPIYNYMDDRSKFIEKDKSAGLRNREAGARVNVDIAGRGAADAGDGFWGQVGAEVKAAGSNYLSNPQLAVQDAVANLPQLIGPAAAGRGLQMGAAALGMAEKTALRAGVAGAVGSGGVMQGVDVGGDAYSRLRAAGVSEDEASRLANQTAMKAGAATLALAALPFGSTIERSLLSGAARARPRLGLGNAASRAVAGGVEATTEAAEEGYGQYAQNQAVAEKVAGTNLAGGVGNAAVQGAVVAGPMGAISHHNAQPRTSTGEIDLTGTPVGPTTLDAPTYARRGLDPLNERSSPYPNPAQQAVQQQNAQNGKGVIMVDSNGQALPAQTPEQMARLEEQRRFTDGIPTLTDVLAGPDGIPTLTNSIGQVGADGIPVLNDVVTPGQPQAARSMADVANPVFTPKPGEPAQFADLMNPAEAPVADPSGAMPVVAPVPPNRGQVMAALARANTSLNGKAVRKDGQLAGTKAAAPLREVLESKDPAASIRALYENGSNPRDELLDVWHKELTGSTVSDAAARVQPEHNSAGFVAEPAAQVAAQIAAVKDGRKDVAVMGEDEARAADLKGLTTAIATDSTGATAVVASLDPKKVAAAVKRAPKVGLKQAMGEALGYANPSLTSASAPGAAVVQHVDDKTGQVINEQLATPTDAANIAPIDGATTRVVSPDQALAKRLQSINDQVAEMMDPKSNRATVSIPANQDIPDSVMSAQTNARKDPGYTMKVQSDGTTLVTNTSKPQAAAKPKAETTNDKKLGHSTIEELIDISENAKDDGPYTAARYELYRRWAKGNEAAETYLTDKKNKSALTKDEENAFHFLYIGELKAKANLASAKLASKFGQVKLRSTSDEAPASGGVTVAQAQGVVDVMVRKWKNVPAVTVVESMQDLPWELRDFANESGATSVMGAFHEGGVYIVANAHASPAQVASTVLHEVAGHYGLRGLLGDTMKSTMANIYNNNSAVRHAADIMMRDEGLDKETAVEEVLADAAEQGRLTMPMIERIRDSIRQLLRKIGLSALANSFSNDEVKSLVIAAREFVENGRTTKLDATPTVFRDAGRAAVAQSDAELRAMVRGKEISSTILSAMTLRQIDEQYGTKLPAMSKWIDAIMSRGAKASDLASRADRIAQSWEQTVPKADRVPLADVLLRASDAEVELDNVDPKYVADLTTKQRAEYDSLRRKLDAMSPEARKVRADVVKTLREQWKYTRDSLESFINQTVADPQMRNARIEDLKHEMGRNRGDYFPFSRFGDRIVIAKNAAADGRDIVSFHESKASADAAVVNHYKAGVKNVVATLKTDFDKQARASGGFVGQVHQLIDNSGVEGPARQELHDALQSIFLRSMPELSGAKSMIRRENVEGFSRDALRVFADAVTRGARYASHLEFAPTIAAARDAAEQQTRSTDKRLASIIIGRKDGAAPKVVVTQVGTDRLNAVNQMQEQGFNAEFFNAMPETAEEHLRGRLEGVSDAEVAAHLAKVADVVGRNDAGYEDLRATKALYNHMLKLQNREVTPNALVDAAGQLGHVWYLGLSPSQWATNLLQNPAVGLPILGSKYGITRATTEMLSTAKWFTGVRMGKLFTDRSAQFSVEWMAKEVADGNLKGISKNELDMLQALQDHKALDFTQAMDLNRISQAGADSVNGFKYKALRFAAAGAHHTEVFNRVTFALAAYRLAMKSDGGVTHEDAVRRAENDTFAAHYDYSPENAPMLMRGNFSRMVFMFQKYRQHQLYWWAKNVKLAVQNETPGDRKKALQAALLMGTTQLVLGGVRALPFVGSIAFLANLLGGSDDDGVPFDFNDWINTAAKEHMGDTAGEMFSQGIFGAMGMNIATRIGQGGLLLNEGSEKYERNADDKVRGYLFDLFGPMGSIALGMAKAYDKALTGDLIGAAAATTPKVISDALKGYQMAQEGLVDHKKGLTIADADRFDASDVMMQSLGVTPRAMSELKADRAEVRNIDQGLKDKTHQLTNAYVQAWQQDDQLGMAEAVERIRVFNTTVPQRFKDAGLIINGNRLVQAVMEFKMQQQRLALTSGTASTMRQIQVANQATLNTPVTRDTMAQKRAEQQLGR